MTRVRAALQALRLRYNAALAAQQGCARAFREASLSGMTPSAALVEVNTRAHAELERARAALLAAMTELITGQPAALVPDDPPPGKPPPGAA